MLDAWLWIWMAAALAPESPRTVYPTASEQACRQDSDCTKTSLDCCGCSAGGVGVGINKRSLDRHSKRRERQCGEAVLCVTAMSSDWSCTGTPVCVDRSCQIAWAIGGTCKTDEDCKSVDVESVCKPRQLTCGSARCIQGGCSVVPRPARPTR